MVPLEVSSTQVEQLMCVVVLVKLNAVVDALTHLHVAEAFFARTDAINFLFTCEYVSEHPCEQTKCDLDMNSA